MARPHNLTHPLLKWNVEVTFLGHHFLITNDIFPNIPSNSLIFLQRKIKFLNFFSGGENFSKISENNLIFSVQLAQVLRVDGRK
jgi:hypothetical protein